MHDPPPPQFDAFIPPEMARRAEEVGVRKATMPAGTAFVLAVLAGAFIAMGAIFATTVTTATQDALPFGIVKLVGGVAFCLGLILVIVAGAELFTGNNLIVMAAASRRVTLTQLFRNWLIVYAGNFVGAVSTAALMLATRQYTFGGGAVGANVLKIAAGKCQLDFTQAVALGIVCNALVCLAVWLCFSARSTTDKILAIIFPITAFVAAGFEHSVANMYFIPMGLLVKAGGVESFWQATGLSPSDFTGLSWGSFFYNNLLPVTIGNILGGAGMVGLVYWYVYSRNKE